MVNDAQTYLPIQKILHWTLAVLLLFWLFVSGELVESAEGDARGFILGIHSGGALVILALTAWRFAVRRGHPVAPLTTLKPWEARWSHRMHLALYATTAILVLSGILHGLFYEETIRAFGFLPLTVGYQEGLNDLFHEAHEILGTVLKLLVILHIVAALKHQFIDRQRLLQRMM